MQPQPHKTSTAIPVAPPPNLLPPVVLSPLPPLSFPGAAPATKPTPPPLAPPPPPPPVAPTPVATAPVAASATKPVHVPGASVAAALANALAAAAAGAAGGGGSNKRKPAPAPKPKPKSTAPQVQNSTAAAATALTTPPRKKLKLSAPPAATAPPTAPLSPASAAIAAVAAASAAVAAAAAASGGAIASPVKERKKTGPKPKPKPPKPTSAAAGGDDDGDDDDSDDGEPGGGEGGKKKKKQAYSRKEKSLGLLCENFLKLYADGITNTQISLDTAATTLMVERRRIYDIVNILESVDIVSRKGKNHYIWHGLTRLAKALTVLQKGANAMRRADEEKRKAEGDDAAAAGGGGGAATQYPSGLAMLSNMAMDDDDTGKKGKRGGGDKREKSLGLLSQKFVQMFLLSDTRIVSLEEAAHALLGTEEEAIKRAAAAGRSKNNFKSKVRRLYDIANVLASLQLIEKIHITQSRRPAFKWCGAEVFPLESSVADNYYTRDQPNKVSALQTPPPKKPKKEKERKSDSKSAAEAAAAAVGGSSLFDSAYDFPSGLKRSNSGLGLSGTPSFSYSRASLYGVLPFDKENLQPNFIRDTSMPLIARKGSKQYQFSMDTLTPTEMAYLTSSTVSTSNGGDRHPLCMPPPQPPAVTNSTVVAPRGGGGSSVPSRAASFSGIGAIADHVSLPPGAAPTHSLLQYVSATAVAVAATPASVAKSILPLSALSHAYGSALAGWDWTLPQLRESATRTLDSAAGNESTSDSSSPSGGGSSIYTIDDDNDNEICVVLHPLPPVAPVPVVPPSPALPPVAIAPVTPAPILAAVSQTSIGAGGSQDPRTDSQVADEFLS